MTTPAARQPLNIRRSLQEALYLRLEVPNTTPSGLALAAGFVDYQDEEFSDAAHDQWVRVERVSGGAGSWKRSMFQIICFTRTAADRVGALMDALVNAVEDAMRQGRGEITLYDFAVPASPVAIAEKKLVVVTPDGYRGEPSEGPATAEAPGGITAQVLTYHVGVFPDDWMSEKYRAP